MAPECARNKTVGFEADVWSLGCILYQLLTGVVPFRGASDYLVFRRSTEARFNLDVCKIPHEAKSLISGCLKVDPAQRLTVS
jgi:3-phosphoinositide dependent protein kinase-1